MRWLFKKRADAVFPPVDQLTPDADGLVAVGADLSERTLIEAYRKGLFPWEGRDPIPWYSPDPRLLLEPSRFHASRSLRKRRRTSGLEVSFDHAFVAVMSACATVPRPGQPTTWLTPRMIGAYAHLHDEGIAHSVEVWAGQRLVGGIYGLAMGKAFFGESMFSRVRDASKLALWRLCEGLAAQGYHFVDCQQDTPHLRTLGAAPVPRAIYLQKLERALSEVGDWAAVMGDDGPEGW